ncbi:hypothetical protein DZC78_14055 [Olleya aquimaris]|nr:hypothetical protein DZC78_14055 [Olleya aquimaris]
MHLTKKHYLFIILIFMQISMFAQDNFDIVFGETFTLKNNTITNVGYQNEFITIELTDLIEEWWYDAPPEDKNRKYHSDIQYTLKITFDDIEKQFSFYRSEIKQDNLYTIKLDGFKIVIISDKYNNTSGSITMKVIK